MGDKLFEFPVDDVEGPLSDVFNGSSDFILSPGTRRHLHPGDNRGHNKPFDVMGESPFRCKAKPHHEHKLDFNSEGGYYGGYVIREKPPEKCCERECFWHSCLVISIVFLCVLLGLIIVHTDSSFDLQTDIGPLLRINSGIL